MNTNSNAGNGPRVDFGTVEVLKVQAGLSDASDIAVLKQSSLTVYPAVQSGNNKVSALFGAADFGDGQSYPGTRNTIVKIPKGMTVEAFAAHLEANAPTGHIYRELSFNIEDVLTKPQLDMIASGDSSKTLEEYKEDKSVKNSETGAKVLIDGKVQYRALHFSTEFKADVDYRNAVATPAAERTQINESELAATIVEPTAEDVQLAGEEAAKM